ncbi:unnamed protein product [Plutella xylostella]|uniref:(diamondback moth) hypothetical protein n=1 Tax=Plutella xylostella TaxID=51655 RepID=A0A8S4D116_PLUXY|nr:unnamed protein product [Plutella xylostella]
MAQKNQTCFTYIGTQHHIRIQNSTHNNHSGHIQTESQFNVFSHH